MQKLLEQRGLKNYQVRKRGKRVAVTAADIHAAMFDGMRPLCLTRASWHDPPPHILASTSRPLSSGATWQVGKSKVFLRAGQMADLDSMRQEKLNNAARVIQRHLRALLQRKAYARLKKATIMAQARWRGEGPPPHPTLHFHVGFRVRASNSGYRVSDSRFSGSNSRDWRGSPLAISGVGFKV